MNSIEEESILQRFKNNYPYFPVGLITHPDKPDFIIEGQQRIGIEITQVFKDQDSPTRSLIVAKGTLKKNLLSNITLAVNKNDFPKCIFAINLNDLVFSKKLNPKVISKLCFEDILAKRNVIKDYGHFEFENNGGLPKIIEGYSISIFGAI